MLKLDRLEAASEGEEEGRAEQRGGSTGKASVEQPAGLFLDG